MKIPAIQQICYRQYYQKKVDKNLQTQPYVFERKNIELSNNFYLPQISFGLQNAAPLKKLFSYGLPCMYTGIEMLDPKMVTNLLKQNFTKISAKDICKYLSPYVDSLMEPERNAFFAIREQANIEPNNNLLEIMQNLKELHEHSLIKKQLPIIKTLHAYSFSLPEDLRLELTYLLKEHESKINNIPIYSAFSPNEFKYKLTKIRNDIAKINSSKCLKTVNNLIKLSQGLEQHIDNSNVKHNKEVLLKIEKQFNRTKALKEYGPLKELIESSIAKLNKEKVLVPFSRKAFIYDLSQIIKKSDDSNLKETIMKIASKLPTSKDSTEAYITKYAKETPEKILYRLLWPSIATIEHLLPKSCGGENDLHNYAGACAQVNSDRQNTPFLIWMKRYPNIQNNCQKYVDRLIDYYEAGIFNKENIDKAYIEDFINTIKILSDDFIKLDISRLEKK